MSLKDEFTMIDYFMSSIQDIKVSPRRFWNRDLQIDLEETQIAILDEEGNRLYTVQTYAEFIRRFMESTIKDSFEDGQNTLRKALKELLNISF